MDDDHGTTRATADAEMGDSHELSPPSLRTQEQGSPSGGGLNPTAAAFVPQQQTTEVEQTPREPPHETAVEAVRRAERREGPADSRTQRRRASARRDPATELFVLGAAENRRENPREIDGSADPPS